MHVARKQQSVEVEQSLRLSLKQILESESLCISNRISGLVFTADRALRMCAEVKASQASVSSQCSRS